MRKKERKGRYLGKAAFLEMITHGPEYVGSSCNRLFFDDQVISCRKESYKGLVKAKAEKYFQEICPQMLRDVIFHVCW